MLGAGLLLVLLRDRSCSQLRLLASVPESDVPVADTVPAAGTTAGVEEGNTAREETRAGQHLSSSEDATRTRPPLVAADYGNPVAPHPDTVLHAPPAAAVLPDSSPAEERIR
mgnify:FL=1